MAEVCAVVLAAGRGTRLWPLTGYRPKALCPVGNVPLLDHALDRAAGLGLVGPADVAVNASWLADQLATHAAGRAHISYEETPRGTAGGLARLREWIAGRAVLVGNVDAYLADGRIDGLLDGWDGETVRLLGVPGTPGDFSGHDFAGYSLLPWRWVRDLPDEPGELVRAVWRPAEAAGAVEVIGFTGYFRDTGTPADYLAANRHAAAGGNLIAPDAVVTGRCEESVVGSRARVEGRLTRSVIWPGVTVAPDEHLVDVIRIG